MASGLIWDDNGNDITMDVLSDAVERMDDITMSNTLCTTRIENADEARAYLAAVGTPGPTLHPHINSRDHLKRWSGVNDTTAVGQDANGNPVFIAAHVGVWETPSYSTGMGYAGHGGSHAFENVAFPIDMLPATSHVRHPEYTPGNDAVEPIWVWLAEQRKAREAAVERGEDHAFLTRSHDLYDLVTKLLSARTMPPMTSEQRETHARLIRIANGFVL